LLQAAPADIDVGLEVPMLTAATAGIGPKERLTDAVAAARDLMGRAQPR
jgi:hypothetical protein